ncbi:acetylglutamate kinase [Costertonia aggregata]|uniref:Acetylglutamate kinase n=1 Tax=Costertonia aggregata TaxID=343403 RepID=A0A7H9AQS0_9FLAO|nr:acetylglutamate kinase [Costertonia aggregata]QLG45762.1 acetylglutamate kinase [Costertonia aggregata]
MKKSRDKHLPLGEAGRGLSIIKIGGNVIENKQELTKFLSLFVKLDGNKILVHGGGKLATQLATRLGIESKMVEGRRITDAETLKIITMVYAGLTNKNIVAQLQTNNCNAIGLSGADGDTIQAHKRPVKEIDYGFAGDVDGVNSQTISKLLEADFIPVFCAMTHDGNGQLLNTNADTIAAEVAIHMSSLYETTLYYCFEKKGVLKDINDENSVIRQIDNRKYTILLNDGVIADGMIPKIDNCFYAVERGVEKVCIGHHSMLDSKNELFTTITL